VKHVENVVMFPYDDKVFYGTDTDGENVYFKILAFFEYEEKSYNVYQFTTHDHAYIGELFTVPSEDTNHSFYSIPLEDGQLFEDIRRAWNEFADTVEDEFYEIVGEEDDEE
jgi:hypothetical protein